MNKKQNEADFIASQIQEAIIENMKKPYSSKAIEMFLAPRNLGTIENPDGFKRYTGPCGDTMEIFLKVKDGVIKDAKFQTDGCGNSIICGCMITLLAEGKTITEARKITNAEVLKELGGLPEEEHCATLAATTLHMALDDYLEKKRNPWKKRYRT